MKMRCFEAYQPEKQGQTDQNVIKGHKNYVKAKKLAWKNDKLVNEAIELGYHSFIASLKKLYTSLPDAKDRTVIEIDKLKDLTCPISMHYFLTPHCYFYLECTYDHRFQVVYQLEKCLIEQEVRKLMKDCFLSKHLIERKKGLPYSEYFLIALRSQKDFTTLL